MRFYKSAKNERASYLETCMLLVVQYSLVETPSIVFG